MRVWIWPGDSAGDCCGDRPGRDWAQGVALSFAVMLRMVGMIIGLSAITSWGMGHFRTITAGLSLGEIISLPDKVTSSFLALFHDFFLAAAVVCLVTVIPAMELGRKKASLILSKKNTDVE